MITVGLGRSRSILFTVFLYLCSGNICMAAMFAPEGADKVPVVEFSKKLITDTLDLSYLVAHELVVSIPGVNQELVINWGFGGSGHMLSPLPWVPVQVRSIKSQAGSSFSITDLGKALAQDKIMSQAKQTSVLKWFVDAQLSPLKLCAVKLFLLAKDFGQNNLDQHRMQSELVRLLVRLSLTDDLGLMDSSKPFSSCIPEVLKELIDKRIPGALSTIDSLLEMFMTDKNSKATDFADKLPRVVYACPFKTEVSANLYFDSLQSFPLKHFLNGKDIIQFDGLTATHTPANMPKELAQAALGVTTLPQLMRVKTADGQHWIGCVTDRIGMTGTVALISAALLATIKEYVTVRKEYLAQHPEEALKLNMHQQAVQQQNRRLYAFKKTDSGIASLDRLAKEIDAIKNAPKVEPAHVKAEQNRVQLSALEQELSTLKAHELMLNNQLAMNAQAMKFAPPVAKAAKQKKENQLLQELADVQVLIQEKESAISVMIASQLLVVDQKTELTDHTQEDKQTLDELYQLAASLKKNGEPVPADLAAMIQELEARIRAANATPVDGMTLDDRLAQREAIAEVYRNEALLLEREVFQRVTAIKMIPEATKRRIDEIKFGTLEKPLFEAYIASLLQKAELILDQNEKMLDLHAYRQAVATLNPVDIAVQDKAKIRILEFEVGMLLDKQGLDINVDAGSGSGLLYALLHDNPEINELLKDLSGDNKAYAQIKERLFGMLGLIAQKSDHVKEFATTYRYLLEKGLPDFLPLFNHVVDTAQ